MQENVFKKVDFKVYSKKLNNGLEVIMLPDKKKNITQALFVTRFGGKDIAYKLKSEKKYTNLPIGTAHFLEHKMFESKANEQNVYDFFDDRGASVNAYTNKYMTTYFFETNNYFYECLEFLLDFVQEINLTEENVAKEKDIIAQEISMGDTDYFTFLNDLVMNNLFVSDSYKYSIDGTINDINKINKDLLLKTYETFYHPKNMFLVITGNFDPKKTIKLIEENQGKKKFKKYIPYEYKKYKESNGVFKKFDEVNFNVKDEKIVVSYKMPLKNFELEKRQIEEYINLILNINFSNTSTYLEWLDENDIVKYLEYSYLVTDSHLIILIQADTKKRKIFLKSLDEKIHSLKLDHKEIEIKKRAALASYIALFDNPLALSDYIATLMIKYKKLDYSEIDLILNLKQDKIQQFLEKLDFNNYLICSLKPKR